MARAGRAARAVQGRAKDSLSWHISPVQLRGWPLHAWVCGGLSHHSERLRRRRRRRFAAASFCPLCPSTLPTRVRPRQRSMRTRPTTVRRRRAAGETAGTSLALLLPPSRPSSASSHSPLRFSSWLPSLSIPALRSRPLRRSSRTCRASPRTRSSALIAAIRRAQSTWRASRSSTTRTRSASGSRCVTSSRKSRATRLVPSLSLTRAAAFSPAPFTTSTGAARDRVPVLGQGGLR